MSENNYSVRLISVVSYVKGMGQDRVIFETTPSFSESRSVTYTPVSPVHMPGEIQVFRNTKSRQFSVGAILISRTYQEAERNMKYLQTLRSWTLPYFGKSGTDPASATSGMLGAPPDVLYLWAYSKANTTERSTIDQGTYSLTNINRVPVVLTSLNIVYPQTVTYIPSRADGSGDPFPVKLEVNLELIETHSPVEYEQFSLEQYKNGLLTSF